MKKIAVLAVVVALSFAGIQDVFGEDQPKNPKKPSPLLRVTDQKPALKVIDPKGKGEIECNVLNDNLNKRSLLHCSAKEITIVIDDERISEWVLIYNPQRGAYCCDDEMRCCAESCCRILEPMCQKGVFDDKTRYPIPPELNCSEE